MDRSNVVLAGLAASNGASHSPVQVQKLFFLMDKNISSQIGGEKFNFSAYDYGPFDKEVYDELESLAQRGLVSINYGPDGKWRTYQLTEQGMAVGRESLQELSEGVQTYISQLSNWVRSQSFAQLVSSVYKAYPEMKANSVFR